jgi:hypothetical protein
MLTASSAVTKENRCNPLHIGCMRPVLYKHATSNSKSILEIQFSKPSNYYPLSVLNVKIWLLDGRITFKGH